MFIFAASLSLGWHQGVAERRVREGAAHFFSSARTTNQA